MLVKKVFHELSFKFCCELTKDNRPDGTADSVGAIVCLVALVKKLLSIHRSIQCTSGELLSEHDEYLWRFVLFGAIEVLFESVQLVQYAIDIVRA